MTVTPACDYAGWVGRKTQGRWAAQFGQAPASKGSLVIVNLQRTPYDTDAAVVCHVFCDKLMELVMRELGLKV